MNNTAQVPIQDYSRFIGISYEEMNCWQFVQYFYMEVFKIELPEYYVDSTKDKKIIYKKIVEEQNNFNRTSVLNMSFGDIILFRILGHPSHVGIYLYDNFFIHCSELIGSSVIERLGNWGRRIDSVWRVHDNI